MQNISQPVHNIPRSTWQYNRLLCHHLTGYLGFILISLSIFRHFVHLFVAFIHSFPFIYLTSFNRLAWVLPTLLLSRLSTIRICHYSNDILPIYPTQLYYSLAIHSITSITLDWFLKSVFLIFYSG